jgi:hypothetical protein
MLKKFGAAGLGNNVVEELRRVLAGKPQKLDNSLWECMSDVQKYLVGCYFLSINALPQLRHTFPQFTWTFVRCKSLSQATRAVAQSDLIWRVNNFVSDWSDWSEEEPVDLVTATSTEPLSKRRKVFFAGDKKASEETTQELEFVKACGGKPEYAEIKNQ